MWISQPGSGSLEKRQCTIQACFTPGKVQPNVALIFKGTGQRIKESEKLQYAEGVDIYWQKKAWADGKFCIAWARRTLANFMGLPEIAISEDRAVLFMDNLRTQTSTEFKQTCSDLGVDPWFLPKNCTDIIQPVDAGYGRELKRQIAYSFQEWTENDDNLDRWEDGNLTAGDRRILITHWVANAVKVVNAKLDTLWRYFEKTGCLMRIDGTGDELITPQGLTGYVFPRPAGDGNHQGMDLDLDEADEGDSTDEDDKLHEDDLDAPDDDVELQELEDEIPEGYEVVDECPPLGRPADRKKLLKRKLMFRWHSPGWGCMSVRKVYAGKSMRLLKPNSRRFELLENRTERSDHMLLESKYSTDPAADGGAWCLLRKVKSVVP